MTDEEAHLLATEDATPTDERPGWQNEDALERPYCLAISPAGDECHRDLGHYDVDTKGRPYWPVAVHVSFDSDSYREWPVGQKSPAQRIAELESRVRAAETETEQLRADNERLQLIYGAYSTEAYQVFKEQLDAAEARITAIRAEIAATNVHGRFNGKEWLAGFDAITARRAAAVLPVPEETP